MSVALQDWRRGCRQRTRLADTYDPADDFDERQETEHSKSAKKFNIRTEFARNVRKKDLEDAEDEEDELHDEVDDHAR